MSEEIVSKKLESFRSDFALLIEGGFIAAKQNDEVLATRIFCAAQILNRHHSAPQIGLGYIALNKMQIKQALTFFNAVLKQEPSNMLAKTFAGMCYLLSKNKRKQGETMVKEAMEKTDDETIKNLGALALKWSEKDLSNPAKATMLVDLPADA